MVVSISLSLDEKVIKALDDEVEKLGGSRSSIANILIAEKLNVRLGSDWRIELDKVLMNYLSKRGVEYNRSIWKDNSGIESIGYRIILPNSKKLCCNITIHKYYVTLDFGVQSVSKKYLLELDKCRKAAQLPSDFLKIYAKRTAIIWESNRMKDLDIASTVALSNTVLYQLEQLIQIFTAFWTLD